MIKKYDGLVIEIDDKLKNELEKLVCKRSRYSICFDTKEICSAPTRLRALTIKYKLSKIYNGKINIKKVSGMNIIKI